MKPDSLKLQRGDYVRFRYLPEDCEPTPIQVTAVNLNGMVQLGFRGWVQPYLLRKVDPPKAERKRA